MNIRSIRTNIASILLILALTGCGGGGDETTVTQPDQETTVTLGVGGKLTFPPGSLPSGTSVTATQMPLPLLTADLVPVGTAWQIDLEQQPSAPVEITLPVPDGESADQLTLVRLESSGRISLLETRVENGMLVARTTGFSITLAARLAEMLAGFKAHIDGPDFLPTHLAGQYSNPSLMNAPAVQRKWHVFERTANMGHQLVVDERPLWDTAARLSAAQPGTLTLMLELTEPATGLNVVAMKDVSVQETLESGQTLDIAVYGPVVVTEGESFDISAVVMNTDITEMASWEWSMGGYYKSGSCLDECSIRLDLNGLDLPAGKTKLKITGRTPSGIFGTASLDINVLSNELRVVRVAQTSNDNALIWDNLSNPEPEVAFAAAIKGGTPPYSYTWYYYKSLGVDSIKTTHVSWDESDSFTQKFDQPGKYTVVVNVKDSADQSAYNRLDVFITGVRPLEYGFTDPPSADLPLNQPVSTTLHASGGVLMHDGQLQEGYKFLINWGDGSDELGIITATHPDSGGDITLEHTYTSVGDYTIKFIIADALRGLTVGELNNIQTVAPDLIRTVTVTIVEASDSIVADAYPRYYTGTATYRETLANNWENTDAVLCESSATWEARLTSGGEIRINFPPPTVSILTSDGADCYERENGSFTDRITGTHSDSSFSIDIGSNYFLRADNNTFLSGSFSETSVQGGYTFEEQATHMDFGKYLLNVSLEFDLARDTTR